jgi:2-(1,2-epoxy-1,2-dihydrophenyl)acetyl-CoA isomerase
MLDRKGGAPYPGCDAVSCWELDAGRPRGAFGKGKPGKGRGGVADAPSIECERRGRVGLVTLNNPAKRNAFTHDMRRALVASMDDLNHDPDVRAVVLTGEGDHFCVGADISGVGGSGPPPRLAMRERMKDVHQIFHMIAGAPKPYVAAVCGDAFGTGMSMALACDWVVGGRAARFGTAFARIGGYPEMGLAATLARRVGEARAKRLLMLCEQVRAPETLALGIVDELADDPLAAAFAYAERLAAAAPLSIAHIKAIFADGIPGITQMLRMEADLAPVLGGGSEDAREGIAALREKREPNFSGR